MQHGSDIGEFQLKITKDLSTGSYILTGIDLGAGVGFSLTNLHGWLLWVGWGIFGFIQILSNRYGKKYWQYYMWVHRFGGTFILLSTIAMSIVGIKKLNWELTGDEGHYIIGLIVFFAVLFVALGGVFARSRTRRLQWKSKVIKRVQIVHKVGSYLFIIRDI